MHLSRDYAYIDADRHTKREWSFYPQSGQRTSTRGKERKEEEREDEEDEEREKTKKTKREKTKRERERERASVSE